MRLILALILTIASLAIYGQKQFLKKADFVHEQLNDSWVIVKITPGTSLELDEGTEVKILHHSTSAKKSILDGVCKIQLKNGQNPIDFCNKLLLQKNVIYAEPITQNQPLYTPSDPNSTNQSYLNNIKAFDAWDITRGDDDIAIGIIDTGIALDHEDLNDNIWINSADPIDGIDNDENGYIDDYRGYDFADEDNDPNGDLSGHGTEVAGIASASTDNSIGISGIGFNTKIAALKGFKSSNNNSNGLYDAIIYAADNGIEVLNLSWGSTKNPLQSEQDIINYAVLEKDVAIVAAAGNDGNKENPENKFYPASYENVLSVGATDFSDNKSVLSTYNHSVDLMAPGDAIYSTRLNDTYGSGFGTSLSSPMVSGAAALLKDQFPQLNARQIMERVRVSADDIYDVGNNIIFDGKMGKGRLNIYRALTENGLKSIRLANVNLTTSIGDQLFFGDTLHIKTDLINYLSKTNNPILTISSDNGLSFSETSLYPGSMQTMQEKEFNIETIIPDSISPNSDLKLRIDIMDGSYHDFQFIEFKTAPDQADFGNENISMTISGNGNLAFIDNSFSDGVGFQTPLGQLMNYAGFLIATSPDSVSDNIINNYINRNRSQDFKEKKNFKLYHHPGADFFGYSEFIDTLHNVVIEQSNLAWKNEEFMILRYRIINNSSDLISNALIGVYTDWNLDDQGKNRSAYNNEKEYIFTTNESENKYTATQVVGSGSIHYSTLNIGSLNGNSSSISDEFSDEMKYHFLTSNQLDSAGNKGAGNDVSSIIAIEIEEMAPFSSEYVNIILAINTTQEGIENTLIAAREKLTFFENNPRVLETFQICDVDQIVIDPRNGSEYEFFEDPKGQDLIATGSTFSPDNITSDTVFYARNIDDNFPSDFFQIRLYLFTDISDFEMSTDTLYLNNDTGVVTFTDTSLGATSWSWDFGQGTTTTIQNPSISFGQEGVYQISLTVANDIGCMDTKTKNLIVASRPQAPSFNDFLICPNETISLNDDDADKLKIYSDLNDSNPITGSTVSVGPFAFDSTVYVSGIYNGFESNKTPVNVSVYNVKADFEVAHDTTSNGFQLQLNALISDESTWQWFVDDVNFGSSSSISIDAKEGAIDIRLEVESAEGCQVSTSKSIQISSSAIPIQSDQLKCTEQSIVIRPKNGTYFGFYSNSSLTELIKKGTQLEITDQEKIYIVGLDDGLPSRAIEVNVSTIPFELSINHTIEQVAAKKKVSFNATSENEVSKYQWYVNGELSEASSNPSLFFESDFYEVVLRAISIEGCTGYDTLHLDFREEILGAEDDQDLIIYPNPSDSYILIISKHTIESISIHSLSGQLLKKIDQPQKDVDISSLEAGLYVIKAYVEGKLLQSYTLVKN